MIKEYDVVLTITHVEAESPEEAIAKARIDTAGLYNAIAEAVEVE